MRYRIVQAMIEEFTAYAHEINGQFEHVYESAVQVRMCGVRSVVSIIVREDPEGTHWGWFEDGEVSMIQTCFAALCMCFPYGIKAEEDKGRGRRIQLSITKADS